VPGVGGDLMTPLKEIPEDLPIRSLTVSTVEVPVRSRGIRGISVGLFFLAYGRLGGDKKGPFESLNKCIFCYFSYFS